MNFADARRLLKDEGYDVRKYGERYPGVIEYEVTRIALGKDGKPCFKQLYLTSSEIKEGATYAQKNLK